MADIERTRELNRLAVQRYKKRHPERVAKNNRRAVMKYKKAHPELVREWARDHRKRYMDKLVELQRKRRQRNGYNLIMSAQEKARHYIELKEQCELCGGKALHRHHPDYSKPLEVSHVCCSCHAKIHVEMRGKVV